MVVNRVRTGNRNGMRRADIQDASKVGRTRKVCPEQGWEGDSWAVRGFTLGVSNADEPARGPSHSHRITGGVRSCESGAFRVLTRTKRRRFGLGA